MQINVQCLLCKEKFLCKQNEAFVLVKHVKQVHPNLTCTHCRNNMDSNSNVDPQNPSKSPVEKKKSFKGTEIKISDKSVQVEWALSQSKESIASLNPTIINSKGEFHSSAKISLSQAESPFEILSIQNIKNLKKHLRNVESGGSKSIEHKSNRETILRTAVTSQSFEPHKDILTKKPLRETYYRTTVEHHQQAVYKVKCPNCNKRKYPTLFCHKESITTSPFTTNLFLKCWSLCFFPSMFPAPAKEYVKCSNCEYFLGIYNHHLQIVDTKEKNLKK